MRRTLSDATSTVELLRPDLMSRLDSETLARARIALRELLSAFDSAIEADISALTLARDRLRSPSPTQEALRELMTHTELVEAHGNRYAAPLVAAIAGSLSMLLNHVPEPIALPLSLVDAHVDALKALAGAFGNRADDPTGIELTHLLREQVQSSIQSWRRSAA